MTRSEILYKLKSKRKELADREGVELFMVFTNKTLEETVKAMPETLEDLKLVKGWGKTKISRYGIEILDILKEAPEKSTNTNDRSQTSDMPGEAVFSVSEFLDAVNITLSRLGIVRVRGEVSEFKHRGGAVYFTLKDVDGEASVKCVLWAWKHEQEYSWLEDGMEIIVEAVSEVYVKFGTFNLRVEKIKPVGEGALQKAYEALKKKLEAKGFFDVARKRPIPKIVQHIGVVTSEKGEAINDFLKNIGEYGLEIVLTDVRVEGNKAEESIISALRLMNTLRPDLDVICLIRGGGGLENLKVFNSEQVAQAIVSSRIPVMTGIGHERDVTIAGLSSDADFSTPTKAADAIRRGREEILREIDTQADTLAVRAEEILREALRTVDIFAGSLADVPNILLERAEARIAGSTYKMETVLERIFALYRELTRQVSNTLTMYLRRIQDYIHAVDGRSRSAREWIQWIVQAQNQRMAVVEARLIPLDPEAPLRRGYSIVYSQDGNVVKDARNAIIGKHIRTRVFKGIIESKVIGTSLENHHE